MKNITSAYEGIWRHVGLLLLTLNLCIEWRKVVSLTPQLLCPWL